jgi:hypothetical protein
MVVDTRRRLEDLPRSRLDSALEFGRPGVHPESSVIGECGPCAGSDPPLLWSRSWLVETRRLELLTLSLQRRCSAN